MNANFDHSYCTTNILKKLTIARCVNFANSYLRIYFSDFQLCCYHTFGDLKYNQANSRDTDRITAFLCVTLAGYGEHNHLSRFDIRTSIGICQQQQLLQSTHHRNEDSGRSTYIKIREKIGWLCGKQQMKHQFHDYKQYHWLEFFNMQFCPTFNNAQLNQVFVRLSL